jgi:hypothetical protein
MINESGSVSEQKPYGHPHDSFRSPISIQSQNSVSSRKKHNKQDRFIPSRICTNLYNIFKDEKPGEEPEHNKSHKYSNFLENSLFGEGSDKKSGKKILRFNDATEK